MPRNRDETLEPHAAPVKPIADRYADLERTLANAVVWRLPASDVIPPADVLIRQFGVDLATAQMIRAAALGGEQ